MSHQMDTEPRVLPYIINHPPYVYSTLIRASLIRASLIRAILCCSTLYDFQQEYHDIKNVFFSNGYSLDYITEKFDQFFEEFNVLTLKSGANETDYNHIRRHIFQREQQQTEIQLKQRMEEQQQDIWYIPSTLNGEDLHNLKEDFKYLWQSFLINEPQFNNVHIKILGLLKYPSNKK